MKASRLIELLVKHMNDEQGGDFEVYVYQGDQTNNIAVVETALPVQRCWLYPGLKRIVIGGE